MGPARDERLAVAIADRHGLPADSVRAVVGGGAVHRLFVVGSGDVRHVVRFAIDPLREDVADAEAWTMRQAAAAGIPSPVVLATGRLDGVSYLVESFVEGRPGTTCRSLDLWRVLGGYARTVHTIPVAADTPDALFTRFGRDLPSAWRSHLDYGLGALTPDDPLIALGVYPLGRQEELRTRLQSLMRTEVTFGLNHGDLSLRNLIVPEDGPPVLMDWDSASVGPSPLGDLVKLLEEHRSSGDPSAVELAAFAEGHGSDLAGLARTADDVAVVGALDLVRWAIDRRPDLITATVDAARDRVAAAFGASEAVFGSPGPVSGGPGAAVGEADARSPG